jgi:L-asparaginase II
MVTARSPDPAPAVLVMRGDRVESRHRVSYAIADASGTLVCGHGDLAGPVYPRSAIKPIQALAMVESGAAEAFSVTDREIAIACGSHSGEPLHVETVRAWLARLGLDEGALACGAHPPFDPDAPARLHRAGAQVSAVHNNCSGKHTGMLTLARHLGAELADYVGAGHPVQQRIAATLGEIAGVGLGAPATDGCGVPTWPMPLANLAAALARLGDPSGLASARAAACRRITAAMIAHPQMVAGTARPCTQIMQAVPGLVVKAGAEGVHVASLPSHRLGLALKVEDGAARAAPVALIGLLDALGILDDASRSALSHLARPRLRNHAGRTVGAIRLAEGWPPLSQGLDHVLHRGQERAKSEAGQESRTAGGPPRDGRGER